jgi:hypothetical protein
MGMGRNVAMGVIGGATTMAARAATRKAMHDRRGIPRLPRKARRGRGIGATLAWAAVAGMVFALADVLQEQRTFTARASS